MTSVGRDQLDVQHAAGLAARGSRRRPHLHVADALAALDAPRQQVAGEDPLDGLFQPDVERDPDGVAGRHTIAMISCPPPGHA